MAKHRKSGESGYSSFLSTSYNSRGLQDAEVVHQDALAAAQAEHDRVRQSAIEAFRLNELRESQLRLQEAVDNEAERLRLEQQRADQAAKYFELQRKHIAIPKPPPPPSPLPPREPTPPPSVAPPKPIEVIKITTKEDAMQHSLQNENPTSLVNQRAIQLSPQDSHSNRPTVTSPPSNSAEQPQVGRPPFQRETAQQPQRQSLPRDLPQSTELASLHILPGAQRYVEIHGRLKQLRAYINDEGKRNPGLKKKMGEMRREIRKSVGQFTDGRGANKTPMNKIVAVLKESLTQIPSPLVDPSVITLTPRSPVEGAINNGDKLPALFIYLLNIFAKAIIAQFIDEAGVSPKTADPIGVVAVSIFGQKELCWRGKSLIEILIAKFRVVCPVLFGIRGSEKTEEGRARLGWKKETGHWVNEQIHNTRMTGLGAGYAAISLRDFSKSALDNPYPPTNYWRTLASIVDTPPQEISSTQFLVLKSLIENFEASFLKFYGDVGKAALRVALIDFPARAPETSVAVTAVRVLADKLMRDVGLHLVSSSGSRMNGFR